MTVLEIILVILLGAALVSLIFLFRIYARCRQELQRMNEERARLERERPTLAHMTRYIADDETRQLIRYRYDLLARILAAEVAGDSSRIDEILEEVDALVADRAEFLRQTRLVYERMQPQMTAILREKGLTDRQVDLLPVCARAQRQDHPAVHAGRPPFPACRPHPQEARPGRARPQHRRLYPLPAEIDSPVGAGE